MTGNERRQRVNEGERSPPGCFFVFCFFTLMMSLLTASLLKLSKYCEVPIVQGCTFKKRSHTLLNVSPMQEHLFDKKYRNDRIQLKFLINTSKQRSETCNSADTCAHTGHRAGLSSLYRVWLGSEAVLHPWISAPSAFILTYRFIHCNAVYFYGCIQYIFQLGFRNMFTNAQVVHILIHEVISHKNIKSNQKKSSCGYEHHCTLIQIWFPRRQNGREKSHFGHLENEREEERGWPQQRKVRSLFLQPTWQHTVVSMLLISRLVNWELRSLLLRLSKLLCSPVGKPGTTKPSEFWRNTGIKKTTKKKLSTLSYLVQKPATHTLFLWKCFQVIFCSCFKQGNRWTKSRAIEVYLSIK